MANSLETQEFHLLFRLLKSDLEADTNLDDFVKSRNQTAKKKDPDARRANPEE
jgi:hypothetical protein